MKSSNHRDATPAQYLEHVRLQKGIKHAQRVRDMLDRRGRLSVVLWTVKHRWFSWIISASAILTGVVGFGADLKILFG